MKYILFISFLFLSFSLVAQNGSRKPLRFQPPESVDSLDISLLGKTPIEISDRTKENALVFICDDMPTYPGGEMAMFRFIGENLKYPYHEAQCVQGKVVVRFVIDKTGDIDSIQIVRSLDPKLDDECVRVLKLMPRWKPATDCMGNIISYRYTLPFVFRIHGELD